MSEIGLPYMGSKRKIAGRILDFIIRSNPSVRYIYDLFGGGGGISLQALYYPNIERVYYNELDRGVVELLRDVVYNGVGSRYYQWVDRDTFHRYKGDNDWLGGLCKVIWGFGNNPLKGYLYGRDIEGDKRLLHSLVVDNDLSIIKVLNDKYGVDIKPMPRGLFNFSIKERRLYYKQYFDFRLQLEHLERLERLEQIAREIGRYRHKLIVSNLSYDEVKIETPIDETVIYLDPPYKGTGQYQHKIDYDKLNEYIRNSPYMIYLSSYESEFPCVLEIPHRSKLSATANNLVYERLFCNR